MELFWFVNATDTIFQWSGDAYKKYLWIYFLIGGVIFLLFHTLQAIALFKIAKREGYKNRWMAFIPFLNIYYMGVLSSKNRFYNISARSFSLAAAIIGFVLCALYVVYYVAEITVFINGFAQPIYDDVGIAAGVHIVVGYKLELPNVFAWMGWVFANFNSYVLSWLGLVYKILMVFVFVCFYRTYASKHYLLYTILSLIFPVYGAIMFSVRNNRGKNYGDFVREQRQMQYRAYQEYMRNNNQQDGSGNYYGGGQGSNTGGNRGDDPFGGLGGNGRSYGQGTGQSGNYGGNANGTGSSNDDPFSDL